MSRKTRGHKLHLSLVEKAKQYAEHAKKVACSAQIESAEKAAYAAQKTEEAIDAQKTYTTSQKRTRRTRRKY